MTQVELAHMTWRQAAAARDRGAAVLIPIGTLEQNGLVCPLAIDTMVAFEVAKRTAQETGAVVAPPINYGFSNRHRGFPVTLSLRPETLTALVLDVSEQLIESGFDHLLLVNTHSTNEPPMEHAMVKIRERHGVLMGYFNPKAMADTLTRDLFPNFLRGHGDARLASMLLSFAPESMHLGEGEPTADGREFEGLPVPAVGKVKVGQVTFELCMEVRDISKTGETGGNPDPAATDAARGAEAMRRVVDAAAECVRAFARLRTRDRG